MRANSGRAPVVLPFALLLATVVSGCSETVQPLVSDGRPYTLWGYFDAVRDTQFVRVVALETLLGTDQAVPIDAQVISVDLTTGERREWKDSIVRFDSMTAGHVFWSRFRAEYEHRYRLEVSRSDGAMSSVEVTVPPKVTLDVEPNPDFVRVPVVIKGDPPRLIGISTIYDAVTVPPSNPWPPGSSPPGPVRYPIRILYSGKTTRSPDGLQLEVNMNEDAEIVRDRFQRVCLNPDLIILRRVIFQVLVGDSTWHPEGGVFDPEILVEPDEMSNVENGYGFVGAGYGLEIRWTPSIQIQRAMGYRVNPPCLMMAVDVPDCQLPGPPCFDNAETPPVIIR